MNYVDRGMRRFWIWMSFFLVVTMAAWASCGTAIDDKDVINAVIRAGYSNPVITERHSFVATWFGCAESDAAAFKVTATNAQKQQVHFTACAGFPFKGITLRF